MCLWNGFSVCVCNLEYSVPLSLHMYRSMFRPEVIRRVELCFFRPCKTSILASDVRNPPRGYPCWTLNFCLYKPCAMCLSGLHFQPCAGSEPDCNCCLSNKCTYMQLRSPEVTRGWIFTYQCTCISFPQCQSCFCMADSVFVSLWASEHRSRVQSQTLEQRRSFVSPSDEDLLLTFEDLQCCVAWARGTEELIWDTGDTTVALHYCML